MLRVTLPGQVRRAVTTTLRRLGVGGCAAHLAGEFGEHPDIAAPRMTWALAMIGSAYQGPPPTPAAALRPLPAAS